MPEQAAQIEKAILRRNVCALLERAPVVRVTVKFAAADDNITLSIQRSLSVKGLVCDSSHIEFSFVILYTR